MAPYARREVGLIAALGMVATAATAYFVGVWAVLPALVALALLSFYRDPKREPPAGDDVVLAAADGKVVVIERGVEGPDGGRVLRIMIFLSVLNVHINRSPCAGRVTEVHYRPGQFRSALRAAASTCNECNTITLAPAGSWPGPVRVRQIAGILARRIVCTARVGDRLAAGQRLGMIKLGSRTEVCLADDPRWQVQVHLGQQVRAGRTVLARLKPPSTT
jgi:phosphatidylserine decarboxylase